MDILYTEQEIQDKLKSLAEKLNQTYDKVTLLITLTGGIYTGIDLSKYLTIPVCLEFIKVSSYGNKQESGDISFEWTSIKKGSDLGNLIIVDDICGTGKTLVYIINYVKSNYKYNDIKTLTLFDKPCRREKNIKPDYFGFTYPTKEFIYGFGLDDCNMYLNCRYVFKKK